MVASIQLEIRPLIARATAVADEASRTATLATAQAEKIDRLVTELARRVDDTAAVIQQAVISALFGYGLAMGVSWFVVRGSVKGGAAILLPLPVAVGMLGLTIVMCTGAALVSIKLMPKRSKWIAPRIWPWA